MNRKDIKTKLKQIEQIPIFVYLLKWLLITTIIGVLVGSVTAFFLITLDWVTNYRENNVWIIALLPLGGLVIGLMYYYWGKDVMKGNNLLIEEFHNSKQVIPLKMAPLVYLGTMITHLLGGSAGREGTAVQMGGAIADQFSHLFKFKPFERKILIVVGISAGFSSVFGTPLAAAIFALEVLILGRMRYEAIVPSFFAAFIAHYACLAWSVSHTHYSIPEVPEMTPVFFLYAVFAGILFGLVALLFSTSTHFFTSLFQRIKYAPWRPFLGGIAIALFVWSIGNTKYIGLGIPTIVASFTESQNSYDFAIKILLTAFTIGAGFKGGEVTPLFFVGATLGNMLVWFIPLPMALLAGMGFVAVFSGATNTPLACTLMGIELFGAQSGLYIGIACVVAYLFSGHKGIYSSQQVGSAKHPIFKYLESYKNNNSV